MMKKRKIFVLALVSVICILFLVFSAFLGVQVVAGSTQLVTNEGTSGVSDSFWEKYGLNYQEFCEQYQVERVEITSTFDGHMIPADYIMTKNGTTDNKTVILVHGLGGNRYTTYPKAEMFLEMGYNVLAYDQRSSNENLAEKTTFGYWEKYDLIDCIDYIRQKAPEQTLGVWGTSFGGATAGLAVGFLDTEKKVDFLILDCPVSSMEWMICETMGQMDMGIPAEYMTWCGNIANKIMLGFSYQDADVPNALKDVDIPVLIMNSKVDDVTPEFMGRDIYEAIQGEHKYIWTVEDSKHAELWIDYNEEYREEVVKLLEMCE